MGSWCGKSYSELELDAQTPFEETKDSGVNKSLLELDTAIKSLKTGDLIFVRNGDLEEKDTGWVRFGVVFYTPTGKPAEVHTLLEYRQLYEEDEDESPEKVRLSTLTNLISKFPITCTIYVRRLQAPADSISLEDIPRRDIDQANMRKLDAVYKGLDSPESVASVFLPTLGIIDSSTLPKRVSFEWLAKRKIPTKPGFRYMPLERLF
jgi:hypothetical protein